MLKGINTDSNKDLRFSTISGLLWGSSQSLKLIRTFRFPSEDHRDLYALNNLFRVYTTNPRREASILTRVLRPWGNISY